MGAITEDEMGGDSRMTVLFARGASGTLNARASVYTGGVHGAPQVTGYVMYIHVHTCNGHAGELIERS